jgi:hypothetical protein
MKRQEGEEKDSATTAKALLTFVATEGSEARAVVTAVAERRESRRGWRARAAPQDPEEHEGGFEGGTSEPEA